MEFWGSGGSGDRDAGILASVAFSEATHAGGAGGAGADGPAPVQDVHSSFKEAFEIRAAAAAQAEVDAAAAVMELNAAAALSQQSTGHGHIDDAAAAGASAPMTEDSRANADELSEATYEGGAGGTELDADADEAPVKFGAAEAHAKLGAAAARAAAFPFRRGGRGGGSAAGTAAARASQSTGQGQIHYNAALGGNAFTYQDGTGGGAAGEERARAHEASGGASSWSPVLEFDAQTTETHAFLAAAAAVTDLDAGQIRTVAYEHGAGGGAARSQQSTVHDRWTTRQRRGPTRLWVTAQQGTSAGGAPTWRSTRQSVRTCTCP